MKIKFLTPVWHGADLYSQGDTTDIDDEEANALIHIGVAEIVIDAEETDSAEPADTAKSEPADVNDGAKD